MSSPPPARDYREWVQLIIATVSLLSAIIVWFYLGIVVKDGQTTDLFKILTGVVTTLLGGSLMILGLGRRG